MSEKNKKKGKLKKYVVPALIVYGSIMHLGLEQVAATSSRTRKKDVRALSTGDCDAILAKLRQTKIYRFRYKPEPATQKPHLGLIAEEAPDEVLDDDGRAVRLMASMGFMMAAIKALAVQQQRILDALPKKRLGPAR